MLVAIAASPAAVRFHRIDLYRRGGVACEVTAPVYVELSPDDGLQPCPYCWPSTIEPDLVGMNLVWAQCRLYDALGAWEDPSARYGAPRPCPTS